VFSVVVVMDGGKVVGYLVEDLSAACSDGAKTKDLTNFPTNCPRPVCNETETEMGQCDPKIMVFFAGTDANGTKLTSNASKLTSLTSFGSTSFLQKLLILDNQSPSQPLLATQVIQSLSTAGASIPIPSILPAFRLSNQPNQSAPSV
jgi:hypothetical protein